MIKQIVGFENYTIDENGKVTNILKLIPTADVVPKAKFDEAMELLKNSAPFANSYSGWWSIQKCQDRYEKLLSEVN